MYKRQINKGTCKKIQEFSSLISNYISQLETKDAYFLAEHIAKSSGVFNDLYNDKSPEGVSRFENIQELLNGLKDFCENNEENLLANYMQDVALLTNQDNESKEDYNKVTLMTVHAAKGLEFPYVFVVGLEQNLFPSLLASDSQENLEEERRLFYVAITRAMEKLYITHAESRRLHGSDTFNPPSRFIKEIPKDLINEIRPRAQTHIPYNRKDFKETKLEFEDEIGISLGQRVMHKSFGEGVVLNYEGSGEAARVQINFDQVGTKWLVMAYANLEKL